MDNDETHYPSASAEAIRAYYDVRDWEACPMSGPGPSLTNCLAWPMSGIGPKAEVDDHAVLGFDPSLYG
jgi:hypothetical protein